VTRSRVWYRPATLYGANAPGLPTPGAGAAGGQAPAGPARAVHLVDAENLLGTAAPGPADVRQLAARYADVIGFGPMDQVVIACSHLAFKTIGFCWTGPQYLLRSGPDGADLALLAVLQHDHIAARFPRVVIASGDHIFAQAVTDLTRSGCSVTIATRRGHLSRTLELAASHRIIYLDPPADPSAGQPAA
jgi:hypothetical protein